MDSVGEGKGGMLWENSIETCLLPYAKWRTSVSLMHEAGHTGPMLCGNLEGWGGEASGRGLQDEGDTCKPMANSCRCMAKAITIL